MAIAFGWFLYRGITYILFGFAGLVVAFCFFFIFSITPPTEAKQISVPPPPPPKVVHLIPYQNIQHGVSIIEIDGCEYILVIINYNIQIIHKQNCKNH